MDKAVKRCHRVEVSMTRAVCRNQQNAEARDAIPAVRCAETANGRTRHDQPILLSTAFHKYVPDKMVETWVVRRPYERTKTKLPDTAH